MIISYIPSNLQPEKFFHFTMWLILPVEFRVHQHTSYGQMRKRVHLLFTTWPGINMINWRPIRPLVAFLHPFSLPVAIFWASCSICRLPIAPSCRNGRTGFESPQWHPELILTLTIFQMSINAREFEPHYIICHFWLRLGVLWWPGKYTRFPLLDYCLHLE